MLSHSNSYKMFVCGGKDYEVDNFFLSHVGKETGLVSNSTFIPRFTATHIGSISFRESMPLPSDSAIHRPIARQSALIPSPSQNYFSNPFGSQPTTSEST